VEIYRLSRLGYVLSHSTRNADTAEWRVIHYLSRMHSATKDKILAEVAGASTTTLRQLRGKRIIIEETGVAV
jgi:hypothetical protein